MYVIVNMRALYEVMSICVYMCRWCLCVRVSMCVCVIVYMCMFYVYVCMSVCLCVYECV